MLDQPVPTKREESSHCCWGEGGLVFCYSSRRENDGGNEWDGNE